ncbi:MAG: MBL fold metallo-hydrolase [Alphaproteobacteria bacterium]|nr:MBL fold metallo-hydrolase [Alphaproteobacteria bacterium]
MRSIRTFTAACGVAVAILAMTDTMVQAQQAPVREISKIAGEVYRFRNNNHYSVFAVTPAGVIATDPINAGAAQWLKEEVQKRFNQPVKYVIYSHDHADHISGGEVFDGAIIVAHEYASGRGRLTVRRYA